jgi:tetratricopeptide (TPR) repeat protein
MCLRSSPDRGDNSPERQKPGSSRRLKSGTCYRRRLASRLLYTTVVHASRMIAAAQQMYRAKQYTGVASLCAEGLEGEPDNLDLRVLRVRALLALRRDEEAKRELSKVLRWGSETAEVFRLLGELAIRQGKAYAALTFLRQAVRLAPDDTRAESLLKVLLSSNQPTVAVEKLPAATATVGCTLAPDDVLAHDAGLPEPAPPVAPMTIESHDLEPEVIESIDAPMGDPMGDVDVAAESPDVIAEYEDPDLPTYEQARPRTRFALGTDYSPPQSAAADLFGRYLVDIGALTPVQLDAALDYHRRAGIPVGAAAVALGYVSAPSVEGAAQAFHLSRYNHS